MEEVLTKELDSIKNNNVRNNIEKLYSHMQGADKILDASKIAEETIEELFKLEYTGQVMIPLDFLRQNPNISRILFSALYSIEEYFGVKEVAEMSGYSVQYIWSEIKRGNIKGTRKSGVWLFDQTSVSEYLNKKGKNK